ncbi:MAG: TPM domain-containing protein [Ignavibacteriae bacterium]|nr:TPM domain-containing protein [Ignavibacteriota bacterium]
MSTKKLKYFLFFIFAIKILAQPEIPTFSNYAVDYTKTLSNDQINYLDNGLKTFDDSTSNQIVFFMNKSLDGYPIEMFTNEVAEKNGIGTKENNNGILFYVAKDDRKMRIEVGYGLEGALPDALASSIIRNEVAPYYKNELYYEGTVAGLNAIMSATKGEYQGNPTNQESQKFPFGLIIIIIFLIIFFLSRKGGKGGPGGFIYYGGGLGGSSRSGGFGGFSSGGGSFGGFSGGGGSFGGGGASGSW